jgi:hypothetical protein
VVKFGKRLLLSVDPRVEVDNCNESPPSREITFFIPKQNSKLVTSALAVVVRRTNTRSKTGALFIQRSAQTSASWL